MEAAGNIRLAAREETTCTIEDVCAAASYLLRWGGTFSLVFRPERLVDLICAMRNNGIEPKRIRFVEKKAGTPPILVLLEGRRGGNPGLLYKSPLVIYNNNGSETADMDRINFRNERKAGNNTSSGTLYLVATPIGNLNDISPRALETLSQADFIAAEDTRVSMKLMNRFEIKKPLLSYHEHNHVSAGQQIVQRLLAGENCALVTDAGTPAISDPGEDIVRLCAEHDIPVLFYPRLLCIDFSPCRFRSANGAVYF